MPISSWFSSLYKLCFVVFTSHFAKLYNKVYDKQKGELFSHLHSLAKSRKEPLELLEIGAGTGANFKYYPTECHVTCLDPNSYMFKFLDKCPNGVVVKKPVIGYAENMLTIEDNSFDAVVATLVMCTVSDVDQTLAEVKRVLKPGGLFLYMQHVIDDDESMLRRIQVLVNPLWKYIFDGCDLTLDLAPCIRKAGFSHVTQHHVMIPYTSLSAIIAAFPLVRPHLIGCAVK